VKARRFCLALGWLLWATAVLTAPVWMPVVVVALITEVAFLPGEWLLRRRMRRAGRWLPRARLCERLWAGSGTLIVEWPTPGWRFCRAWWTPESIECPQALSEPRRVRQFDRWP
jgi:hypothetical protein